MALHAVARRFGSHRRVSSRAYRPSLGDDGTSLKLEFRCAAVSFVGIGSLGTAAANAVSWVNGIWVGGGTLPVPGGGAIGSALKGWVYRRPVYTPPVITWFVQVDLAESGTVTSSITPNAAGSSVASIQIVGGHQHLDTVTVYDSGVFSVGGVSLGNPINAQITTAGSHTPYSWEVQDPSLPFNPNWTVTVDFSVTIGAPTTEFTQSAYLYIKSSQMTINVGTGLFGPSVPNGQGGIEIVDVNNNLLYQDITFVTGTYHHVWTLPASQFEQIEYGSQFVTGPAGNFTTGITNAIHSFSYSFKVTLNP